MLSVELFFNDPQLCLSSFADKLFLSFIFRRPFASLEIATGLLLTHIWLCWSLRSLCLGLCVINLQQISGFTSFNCYISILVVILYTLKFLFSFSLRRGFPKFFPMYYLWARQIIISK